MPHTTRCRITSRCTGASNAGRFAYAGIGCAKYNPCSGNNCVKRRPGDLKRYQEVIKLFRITIRRLLVFMMLVGFLLSIFVTKSHLRAVAFFISNDDVVYEAEAKSIRLTGATRLLCLFGHQSWPVFSRCLDDPDKYVAAHFALSRLVDRHGGELGLRGHDRFTHMRMKGTIVESSTLRIDPESHQVVRQMWSQYLNRLSQQGRNGGVYYLHLFDLDEIEELCVEGYKELDSEEAKNEINTPD